MSKESENVENPPTEWVSVNAVVLKDAADELDRLTARVAELEEALRPFASVSSQWSETAAPDVRLSLDCYDGTEAARFTLDDFRRARAILERKD